MNVKRYVNIAFVLCGLLLWVVLTPFFAWLLELIAPTWDVPVIGVALRTSNLLGLVAAAIGVSVAWSNERLYGMAMEIGNELAKVTWPKWEETRISTVVVVVATLIIAAILGVFDFVWAKLTGWLYQIG